MAFGVNRFFRHRYAPAGLTLVLGLAASGGLGWQLHHEAVALDRQRLALRIAEMVDQLDGRLENTEMLLRQLQDYLMLSGETRRKVFLDWCLQRRLPFNYSWVHGIAVATNRHEPQWRQALPKPPETWTAADWATLRGLARKQPIECVVALKSNVRDGKRFLADYNLKGQWAGTNQFARAIHGSGLGMSERRTVMLDAHSNAITGTLLFAPVYQAEAADLLADMSWVRGERTAPVRWLHLTSMILAPIDFKVLEQSVWNGLPSDLGVELFSSTNQTAETWLNVSAGGPHAADPRFKAYLTHRLRWRMYGNSFSIFFYTTTLFEAQSPRRLARIAIATGTVMSLLASALVGLALRARSRQERMTEQIREARDALAAAQQERNRFSRDLHDGTIQSLYAIQLGLGHTVQQLEAEPASQRELSAVRGELDAVIAEIRHFITAEVGADKPVDLSGVLGALASRASVGPTTHIELHCDPDASDRLTGNQAVQLANIAREALSNSLRHAKPRRVEIALRSEQETVVLEISDDGVGFDPKSPSRTGVGLGSMEARAKEMGATLNIQSSPGKGTGIVVRAPVSALETSEEE